MTEQYTLLRERFIDDNAPRIQSKYIFSSPMRFTGKTWVYEIVSKSSNQILGFVKWHGPWRQYWFTPERDTGFNPACLRDIAQFCDGLMEERRLSLLIASGDKINE